MTDIVLGKLIDSPQERDAIHVAVVPLIAGEDLYCGTRFKLAFGTTDVALKGNYNEKEAIGVVDPFLSDRIIIRKGQQFWGLLFPGTVTGMRHHWRHPSFENIPVAKNEHEQWLRTFCDKYNFDFDELIEAGIGVNEYVVARGKDLHSSKELETGEETLFWEHLEGYTGRKFDLNHRQKLEWSCSC